MENQDPKRTLDQPVVELRRKSSGWLFRIILVVLVTLLVFAVVSEVQESERRHDELNARGTLHKWLLHFTTIMICMEDSRPLLFGTQMARPFIAGGRSSCRFLDTTSSFSKRLI